MRTPYDTMRRYDVALADIDYFQESIKCQNAYLIARGPNPLASDLRESLWCPL